MLRSIGKQSGGIRGVSPEEEKQGYGGKYLQKRKVLNLEWESEGANDRYNQYYYFKRTRVNSFLTAYKHTTGYSVLSAHNKFC